MYGHGGVGSRSNVSSALENVISTMAGSMGLDSGRGIAPLAVLVAVRRILSGQYLLAPVWIAFLGSVH